jgi:hypothetical protein
MTLVGVDFQALSAASAQIQAAADQFARGSGQVEGTPRAEGATAEASSLLDGALTALSDALGKAAAELQQVSTHIAATADIYARTEQALAAWHVPGST